jgi:flagellar motor protein MotB|tara:strand:+ start:252 stop:497 length:246 start_codon:yes stop_codon:yes gene_type:complete
MGKIKTKRKIKTFEQLGESLRDPRFDGSIEIIQTPDSLALKINDSDFFVMNSREASKTFIQKMIDNHQKVFENNDGITDEK